MNYGTGIQNPEDGIQNSEDRIQVLTINNFLKTENVKNKAV